MLRLSAALEEDRSRYAHPGDFDQVELNRHGITAEIEACGCVYCVICS
jgi:hypothetical protein